MMEIYALHGLSGTGSKVTIDIYSKVHFLETQYYYRLIQETCFLPKDLKKSSVILFLCLSFNGAQLLMFDS